MYPNFNSYFNPRGKTRFYITIIELASWAYNKTQSTQEGDQYHDAYSRFAALFDKAQTLFDGTKTYQDPQKLHEAQPSIISYPQILDPQSADLINFYLSNFGERLLMNPVEVGKFNPSFDIMKVMDYDDAMYATLTRTEFLIDHFVQNNQEKYLRLLALLNLKYNPIDNYDGVEKEDFDYEGEETMDRDVKSFQLGGLKVSGPAQNVSIGTDPETGLPVLNGSFNESYKKGMAIASASDTENGKTKGTPSITNGVPAASTNSGAENRTEHYTTTYDNSATNRLESSDKNLGSVAATQTGVSEEDVPVMMEATSGAPNAPSYSDTKSFDNRKDKRDLRKWGNMGVTTSQQMINQEREMLMDGWNIVQTFCDDLNHTIMLGVYQF